MNLPIRGGQSRGAGRLMRTLNKLRLQSAPAAQKTKKGKERRDWPVPVIRLHDLRRSAATTLLTKG
jgi:hypothetical protein